ncbi:zinc-dependent alcohol dehydrogenase family protein [Burkholderia gladioli]|uniref:zinc-dependent alcohol dehydrogenase family protein n=1 Tax=Burkholderia gladioli TaxID=28095 RepID=UPI001ABA7E29|nr:NAD(P)-dependent alcohol dehydrogenase [Burkholderia gladioli]
MELIAYRQMTPGNPASLARVTEEIPEPGAGEVLVRIRATSLNARDLAVLSGRYPFPAKPGVIPLSDAAGEILAVGAGVTRFSIGDRVVNSFYPQWFGGPLRVRPTQYATSMDGWLATHRVVSAEALSRMPVHLSFEEAATLPCSGVTAWSALQGISSGDTVLTQGSGGVSLYAIQLAKQSGARVLATTTSAHKADQLKALGADEVIDVRSIPEWAAEVKKLTQGIGADRIVEVGGPGTLEQSIRAVAYHGQVSIIGALSAGPDQSSIDFKQLFVSQARYECIGVGSRADLEDLIRTVANHQLRPVIDSVFSFDNFDKALARLAGRDVLGKVVVAHA